MSEHTLEKLQSSNNKVSIELISILEKEISDGNGICWFSMILLIETNQMNLINSFITLIHSQNPQISESVCYCSILFNFIIFSNNQTISKSRVFNYCQFPSECHFFHN